MESSGFILHQPKSVLRSHLDARHMHDSQNRAYHHQKPETRSKPFIIPVFLPNIGCPHQCIFCNQAAITRMKQEIPSPKKLDKIIKHFLRYRGKERDLTQIAFFGGNFLGLRASHMIPLLQEAGKFVTAGKVDSLRFSTRPDTINQKTLDMLNSFPVSTIELGVQSMDDHVLTMSKRGHTSIDTQKAVGLLKKRNYEIGLQMMVGLPGDDETKAQYTGRKIVDLSPDFVRIYPTVVLAESRLARWYQNGKYTPIPLEQCITLVKNLYLLLRKNDIRVVRMGLQASEHFEKATEILAGPYHPAFGHLVFSRIFLDMATAILESEVSAKDEICMAVHPRSISKLRGIKNINIEILKRKFNIKTIKVISEPTISQESLIVNDRLRQFLQYP